MAATTASSTRSGPASAAASLFLTLALVVAVPPAPTEAATLSVCPSGCTYTSIQDAVDAAVSGDTIAIGAGTYLENVVIERGAGFSLTLDGAGVAVTVIDGGGEDIALRVGEGTDVTVADLTIRNGGSPGYDDGTAYWETGVLVNLEWVQTFTPAEGLDTNLQLFTDGAEEPVLAETSGTAEYFEVWGQSFTLPAGAEAQQLTGFRFLRADGTTPAGAGNAYVFGDGLPPGYVGADELATQAYLAAGAWDGDVFDFSGSGVTLTPGTVYVLLVDSPFYAGALDLDDPTNCGGGVNVQGRLSLADAVVTDNVAGTSGAGICVLTPYDPFPGSDPVEVSLDLTDTVVSDNVTSEEGGGIFTGEDVPSLTIDGSTISGNRARLGGGIYTGESLGASTVVAISDSVIADNVASSIGGGLYSGIAADVTVTDSEVSGNEATGFHGGGIANSGLTYGVSRLTVERSTVSGNTAGSDGGGIFNGNPYGVGGYARLELVDSTVSGNVAGNRGGGVRTTGERAAVTNSTVSGNEAATGGGLSADAMPSNPLPDPVLVTSSTVAANTGGGVHNAWKVELLGSIVADNVDGDCTGVLQGQLGVGIVSLGQNLDSDGTCPLDVTTDLSAVDPLLGALQDNGGPTATHEPGAGSPAVDPAFGLAGGQAYLSGGATFTAQPGSDLNVRVTTTVGEPIVESTDGIVPTFNRLGQSFTTPSGTLALDLGGFAFLAADGTTPVGAGVAYLFDHEYTGMVDDLRTSDALASGAWDASAGVYDLSGAGRSLLPDTTYWVYADEPMTAGISIWECPVATDQRGVDRPQDGDGDGWAVCDIGAVEVTAPADTTPPVVTPIVAGTLGLGGWYVSDVQVSWSVTDAESAITSTDGCDPVVVDQDTAGRTLTCSATSAGGTTSESVTIARDATDPTITWAGDIADGDVFAYGEVPPEPTCSAADAMSGPASCGVTGYGTSVGAHTLTALAADVAGNTASESRTYTVEAWTLVGFHPPVTMGEDIWNDVKAGSTVPLKFEVFVGVVELTDTDVVASYGAVPTVCPGDTSVVGDRPGKSTLRYDADTGQFVITWRTPKTRGACFLYTVTTVDGSSLTASFRLF